jgi:ParB family chromosome partitioning protein
MGHARALLAVHDAEAQRALARRIEVEKLSVRDVERIARDSDTPTVEPVAQEERSAHVVDLERQLTERLGTRVSLRDKRGRGRIVIDYYSSEDLDRVLGLLLGVEHV